METGPATQSPVAEVEPCSTSAFWSRRPPATPCDSTATSRGAVVGRWSLRFWYCESAFRAWSHCDKSRKNLLRFLGRLGYLPPGGKFGLKSGQRKSLPKGRFSAEDYNLQITLSPALRRCFFEVYVFVLFFDEVGG